MMLRRSFLLLAAAAALVSAQAQPKLVLLVMVDQCRYDYMTRWDSEYKGGFRRLLDQGAVFTNANYEAFPTVTAVGHSTVMTGATPSVSGIVGNTWWSREEGTSVQSITDTSVNPLGANGAGASPKRLMVSTVADELKASGKGGKAIGISLKDRSAILPVGHRADGAYWFDARTGNFISSTFYFDALPGWVSTYNTARPADGFAGKQWAGGAMPAAAGTQLYNAVDSSPFGDDLVLAFALKALDEENLGRGPKTDFLSVSFSSVDYVGHSRGPDAPVMRDMLLNADRAVGALIDAAEQRVGANNLLVVFTADHGVSPVPEENVKNKMPGGRVNTRAEREAVQQALAARFGPGEYVAAVSEGGLYFREETIAAGKLDRTEMEKVAAAVLRAQPHMFRVYTRTEMMSGTASGDLIDQRVRRGYHARSADVVAIHEPYWLGGGGTNHGTPFSYDTHVPLMLLGPQVRPGRYHGEAAIQDIAPTVATVLGIAAPSGSVGRVLGESLR